MTVRMTLAVLPVVAALAVAVVGCGAKPVNGDHPGTDDAGGGSGASGASTGTTGASGAGVTSGSGMSGGGGSGATSGASTAGGSGSGTGSGSNASKSSDAGGAGACDAGPSVTPAPLGALCLPEQEHDPSFGGFSLREVSIESGDFACESRICLVDHFQGRVTCPYGQAAPGVGPDGTPGCLTPGTCAQVNPLIGQTVAPQCANRNAADAVYCSCRCANANGGTDDAGTYCTCPSDMICTQLVTSIGSADQGLTGAYCVKAGEEYDAGAGCSKCTPTTAPCP